MKRLLSLALVVMLVLSLFTACGGDSAGTNPGGEAAPAAPSGEKDSVIVAMNADPTGFDPQVTLDATAMMVMYNIYDTLVESDGACSSDIRPGLAESWDISDDNMVYTFHLKSGVKFHNGEPFTAADAKAAAERGEKTILVRLETSPEDIEGMSASEGILTVRGGRTSHAAVVARGMGRCCVAGCGDILINEEEKYFTVAGQTVREGDKLSIDGTTGCVYIGESATAPATIAGDFETFMKWADEKRTLRVRTNADTPKDARQAVAFGAEGVGLCRTEHMFFEADRIAAMREMIVSKTVEQREAALAKLLPMQRQDFEGIFRAMGGLPVTIRFLDPPLHEFLPTEEDDIRALAAEMRLPVAELKATIASLHEFNPMMGHRGCRLAVSYPEIAVMQTTAVIEAALNVAAEGISAEPEIMIPLVCDVQELKRVKKTVTETADRIIAERNAKLTYKVGTMIEIPRAALTADAIAAEAEFFSFGTNDLTQMTYGFSRDDAGKFLKDYYETGIFESDPFAKLDQTGVGQLVRIAAEKGRAARPSIKMGICGEHGGDPSSIEFCHRLGLSYVSCSPYRVPIARLAAAQARIRAELG